MQKGRHTSHVTKLEMQVDLRRLGYLDVDRDDRLVEVTIYAANPVDGPDEDKVRVSWNGWDWVRRGGRRYERDFMPEWLDDVFKHVDDRVGDLW